MWDEKEDKYTVTDPLLLMRSTPSSLTLGAHITQFTQPNNILSHQISLLSKKTPHNFKKTKCVMKNEFREKLSNPKILLTPYVESTRNSRKFYTSEI